mmetsp:Transcript_13059/g.23987  ORF Transcript_13059/g.23987 Transcript_13059/m.23987 type:complete len:235 (+) Transcript_13059:103-807(+)
MRLISSSTIWPSVTSLYMYIQESDNPCRSLLSAMNSLTHKTCLLFLRLFGLLSIAQLKIIFPHVSIHSLPTTPVIQIISNASSHLHGVNISTSITITNRPRPPRPILRPLQLIRIAIPLEPRVRQRLLGRVSILNAVREQTAHEGHGIVAHIAEQFMRKLVLAVHDGGLDGLVVLSVKGRSSRQKHVNDDAQTPQVACLRVRFLEDLGRDIVRRADDAGESMTGGVVRGEAKVD